MQTKKFTVPESRRVTTITPHYVLMSVLENFIDQKDEKYLHANLGFIAMGEMIGIGDNSTIDKVKKRLNPEEIESVSMAKNYMANVGLGLNDVGKTLGVLFNVSLAEYAIKQLDALQIDTFHGLIKPEGIVDFIKAIANAEFEIGLETVSGADVFYNIFAATPAPDANWMAICLQLATVDRLNIVVIGTLIGKLRMEHANPLELDGTIRDTATKIGFSNSKIASA